MNYNSYLLTEHWKEFRQKVLHFWDHRCCLCNEPANIVHHRTYDRIGKEKVSDCVLLCQTCNDLFHGTISKVTSFERWADSRLGTGWRDGDTDAIRAAYDLERTFGGQGK